MYILLKIANLFSYIMFMRQLLLCSVMKVARYSVAVDPNDMRCWKKKKDEQVVTAKVVL